MIIACVSRVRRYTPESMRSAQILAQTSRLDDVPQLPRRSRSVLENLSFAKTSPNLIAKSRTSTRRHGGLHFISTYRNHDRTEFSSPSALESATPAGPPCIPPSPSETTVYIYPTGNAIRRQHIPPANDIARACSTKHKGRQEQPDVEPEQPETFEHRGG